jgi:class 3 adenylate cyclase
LPAALRCAAGEGSALATCLRNALDVHIAAHLYGYKRSSIKERQRPSVDFPSVVDAVRCAVEMHRGMAARNAGIPPEERIEFRVGMRTLGHHWEVAMNTIHGPSGT